MINLQWHKANYEYWDNHYSTHMLCSRTSPSQFATFVAQEASDLNLRQIMEFGCGTGQDAEFFSQLGFRVCATDASSAAIQKFRQHKVQNSNLETRILDATKSFSLPENLDWKKAIAFYGRFFLHTLTSDEAVLFFENLSSKMKFNDYLFLEYRSPEDRLKPKVTKQHFRNYFSAESVVVLAQQHDIAVQYEVEGRGMAKWKADDATVVRQIFKKGQNNG